MRCWGLTIWADCDKLTSAAALYWLAQIRWRDGGGDGESLTKGFNAH